MKLSNKMILTFSTLIGCSLLSVSLAGYLYTASVFKESINNEMEILVISQVESLDGWLAGKAKVLQAMQATVAALPNPKEIPSSYLAGYKSFDKEILSIYFGTVDGRMINAYDWTPPPGWDPRVRPWYKQAQTSGQMVFINPYIDGATSKWCVSVSMPQKDSNRNFIGVISEDILLDTMTDMAKDINLRGQGHAFIFDAQGNIMAHQDSGLLGKNVLEIDKMKDLRNIFKDMLIQQKGFATYNYNGEEHITFYQKIPSTGWTLGVTVPTSAVYSPLKELKTIFGGVTLVIIAVSFFIIRILAGKMTGPLTTLTSYAKQIAAGDLTVQIQMQGKDELSELGQAFNTMNNRLRDLIKDIITSGSSVADTAADMKKAAEQTGAVSVQITNAVSDIAKGASEQLISIQQEVTIIEAMAGAITNVTQDYKKSAQLVIGAQNALAASNKAMEEQTGLMAQSKLAADNVGNTIAELAEKSGKIGQFIEVITSIAGQTNLLALNAAIEAARAGEQGRGFAVVAEEVRKLAEQSGESAQQITKLVNEIQATMEQAVNEMDKTVDVISNQERSAGEVKGYFAKINDAVERIVEQIKLVQNESEESAQKAKEVQMVSGNIAEVATGSAATTEEVAASVEEQLATIQKIAHEADELLGVAEQLSKDIAVFKI
jgi:methyl-accepting chemotaxis protein